MRRKSGKISFFCRVLPVFLGVGFAGQSLAAGPCVTDDLDRKVCLEQPAKRIIALSPGATELAFAAGAGAQMVAAVSFSDYPPAARKLPRVGSYNRLDMEAILAQKPDLIIAWRSGNPQSQTEQLAAMSVPVYFSEPRRFEDVSTTLERLATLAGTESVGKGAADTLRSGIAALRARYANAAPVSVFYQIWDDPLMTINGEHLISEALGVCGGVNAFADLPALAPRISTEAVLKKNPEAIVAGGMGEENTDWLKPWQAFGSLQAVQRGNLFFISPSELQRPTPKMLVGTRALCTHLESARARR